MLGDIRCLAHIINLAAQDVLKSLRSYTVNIDEEQPPQGELKNEVLDDIDLDVEIDNDDEFEWVDVGSEADGKINVK